VTIYEPKITINGKIQCRRDQLLIVSLNEPSTVISISIFVGSEVTLIALNNHLLSDSERLTYLL
jgi:hypothetical protein